jgi:uncharacterized protein YbaR (Trm112 family)
MLPAELVDLLVCPKSKQPLIYFPRGEDNLDDGDGFLLCPDSRLRYRIEHGVPVMLIDEATELAWDAVAKLVVRAKALGLAVPAAHVSPQV